MNAGMKNGINLLMILVLFISCVQEKEDDNVLSRVEACMELFPDSALSLLSQIDCPECLRGQQRADYALLLTQALDKNYLDNLQSDSLIMIAVEYYKQEGAAHGVREVPHGVGVQVHHAEFFPEQAAVCALGVERSGRGPAFGLQARVADARTDRRREPFAVIVKTAALRLR